FVEATLGAAETAGADVEAAAVEAHHRDAESFALGADTIGDRHADFIEINLGRRLRGPAELLLLRAEADAGNILFDNQRGNALRTLLASADHSDVDLIFATAGDERLGTGDDIFIAVEDCLGLERRRIRP